jgi:group II intron reverse transcriptase/maturase
VVNTAAPGTTDKEAAARVLEIQTKLHQWATGDPNRRFDDLDNLVCDPAFLVTAWTRVRGNRGARTAGVDGQSAHYVSRELGEEKFLSDLRDQLRARTFRPLPVRERMIPKPNGKFRRLGIATVRDRVVQAALKLVLEPIFEADFQPCSYGFRPGRRTHDAIAEIQYLCSRSYEWIVEGDIKACSDEIDHVALMDRVRERVGDKRVLALIKAFLKAGILGEDGVERDTVTGTPQGGILSPLLSNVALAVLDKHFAEAWAAMGATSAARQQLRLKGQATYRLVRYADDFVVLVAGTREHAEHLCDVSAAVLQPNGETVHLLLPEQGRTGQCEGEVANVDSRGHGPTAEHPPAPDQPSAPGVDQLLPIRLVQGDIQLPPGVRMAPGHLLAALQVRAHLVGEAPPSPSRWMVAGGGHGLAFQPRRCSGCPLSLPGESHTDALGCGSVGEAIDSVGMNLWRAGCVGTRTSGSESGSGKRTSPKGGYRAPARLYRLALKLPPDEAMKLLRHWLNWACRCRLEPFVKLARTIREYVPLTETTLTYHLTNARTESLNTKLRLITRRAFGFHSPDALIALAMLALGGLCPPLPHMSNPGRLPTAA